MKSLWMDTVQLPEFQRLDKDMNTDVLIIGGGITGILCAYFLHQKGANYVLVEGDRIGSGVTGNTTGKITSLHGLIYDKLISDKGEDTARKYYQIQQKAIEEYHKLSLLGECDYEERDGYVYSVDDRMAIEREVEAIRSIGGKADFVEKSKLPFSIAGAVKVPKQAQIHPLKCLERIVPELHIKEHSFIYKIEKNTAYCNHNKIKANSIIVATHFPFWNLHGSYFMKMYQRRSYVLALKTSEDLEGIYKEGVQDGISLRNAGDYLLIGGGGHRTGKEGGNWETLREFAAGYYPEAEECYQFAAQDCITLDGIPYIGQYSQNTPNIYVATGFNKWGMTSAMVSAMILSDQITNVENQYADIFSPSRSMLQPQLLNNTGDALLGLSSISPKRCTHMGCALKWNALEQSWDCPCHGSRFAENGEVLNNPATERLN